MRADLALAQNFKGYRTTTLDAVIDEWNGKTKAEGSGSSRNERIAGMRDAKFGVGVEDPDLTSLVRPTSYFSAAISFTAFSSSTLTSSLRLAGGNSAMPSWRGITCICR